MMDWNGIATAVASVATAIGVGIGAWQIRENSKLAQTQFEDSLDQQYRQLSMTIPVNALIGKPVSEAQWQETRECIYNYLDLCNEQVYLRHQRRIRPDTWRDWAQGIEANLSKQAFSDIWAEVKAEAPATFSSLERLETAGFAEDPATWK